jgi:hypothetical protein
MSIAALMVYIHADGMPEQRIRLAASPCVPAIDDGRHHR